mmetsp:Transcript_14862/g.37783  ORF Transcript_14862/g.37783 Transcript_14862/m.37783 type:complete len:449 (+) Transcript_14862:451-1797(+)
MTDVERMSAADIARALEAGSEKNGIDGNEYRIFKKLKSRPTKNNIKQKHTAYRVSNNLKPKNAAYHVQSEKKKERRVANFCAGPAAISDAVLLSLRDELMSFEGTGMGLIEHSHRDVGGPVQTCMKETCDLIRTILKVPENYEILIMQGGAHGQFAAVPLNLLGNKKRAAYVDGGFWSVKAAEEAKKYCKVDMIAPMREDREGRLCYPPLSEWNVSKEDYAYVHICANETISGMEFLTEPSLGTLECPLVADFTSTLFSRPVDIAKYGVIYASGGKNLGPSGHVLVIVNKDLLGREMSFTPGILSYATAASTSPMPNLWYTPNVFALRALHFLTKEVHKSGGLGACEARSIRRSEALYKVIDGSRGFYTSRVTPAFRSRVTIPLRIKGGREDLEAKFLKEAQCCNLRQLDGHHTVGGLRVCIYNSLPDNALDCLLDFMVKFQRKHVNE